MSERIRYEATNIEKTQWKSVKAYQHPTNGARFRILVDKIESKWTILDEVGERVASTGHKTHEVKLLKDAREGLEQLGVTLHTEKRSPRRKKEKV